MGLFIPGAKVMSIHRSDLEAKRSILFDFSYRHIKKRPPEGSR